MHKTLHGHMQPEEMPTQYRALSTQTSSRDSVSLPLHQYSRVMLKLDRHSEPRDLLKS